MSDELKETGFICYAGDLFPDTYFCLRKGGKIYRVIGTSGVPVKRHISAFPTHADNAGEIMFFHFTIKVNEVKKHLI